MGKVTGFRPSSKGFLKKRIEEELILVLLKLVLFNQGFGSLQQPFFPFEEERISASSVQNFPIEEG